jgi:hypothetical protein
MFDCAKRTNIGVGVIISKKARQNVLKRLGVIKIAPKIRRRIRKY